MCADATNAGQEPPDGLNRRSLMLAALLGLGGCAGRGNLPPLVDLYELAARSQARPPLIVIPGAFGTRLKRLSDGKEIWPGPNRSLLFSNYTDIELPIDPQTLEPISDDVATDGLFIEAFGLDFYGSLLETLETTAGYRRGSTTAPADPSMPTYYIYEYDWRLDTAVIVRGLHEFIERIAELHGDASHKVDILAHSNGGLIARYYARYGATDMLGADAQRPRADGGAPPAVTNGSARIRQMLLVGAPNLGTIQAVLSHVRGEDVGFRHIPAEVVLSCPGSTQLMPAPSHTSLLDERGDALGLDIYDAATWRELGWSIFDASVRERVQRHRGRDAAAHLELLEAWLDKRLARGRRLHAVLAAPPGPAEPRPILFGGDCTSTLSRLAVLPHRGGYRVYEHAGRVPRGGRQIDFDGLMNEAGDGVVTRTSLIGVESTGGAHAAQAGSAGGGGTGPISAGSTGPVGAGQAYFLCAKHKAIMRNAVFQDNLLYTLLETETAAHRPSAGSVRADA